MTTSETRRAALAVALALAAAGGAQAQGMPGPGALPPEPGAIRASAMGEAPVAPDQAQLMLAVETEAPTAQAAGQENARRMQRVIEALVRAGLPRDSIETQNYALYPQYDPNTDSGSRAPRVVSYRATNQVVAKTTQLERTGALIDVALAAGANRFDAVNFLARNSEAAQREALRRAVERARADAEVMATALGARLGPVLEASNGLIAGPQPEAVRFRARAAPEMAEAPTPIQPGRQTVTAQARVVFSLEPGR